MKANHSSADAALRKAVLEILDHCPQKDKPEDCPLADVRKLSPGAKKLWVNGLAKNDLSHLASYHHICLKLAFESGHPRWHARHH